MPQRSILKIIEHKLGALLLALTRYFFQVSAVLLFILFILALTEAVFYLLNSEKQPFLFNKNVFTESRDPFLEGFSSESDFGFHPTLGWARDYSKSKNVTILHNSVFLENIPNPELDTTIIVITGGSAADLMFLSFNWPALLYDKFVEANQNCQIYVSAVSGYNTSQELLKFLSEGLEIKN